jgi:hypothetical protein
MAVIGVNVYAGGTFTTAGNVGASRVARWDGTNWSPLGGGTDGSVDVLAVNGTDLFAGGWFTTGGGAAANYIASWDGTGWSALGSGTNGQVSAIEVVGSDLYVGGWFTTAGEKPSVCLGQWRLLAPTGATEGPPSSHKNRILWQNTPNPFNPSTTIAFDLPAAGPLRLSVFDVAGRLVRTLVDDSMPQGSHKTVWDGRDSSGREVGSGSYLARLEFWGKVETIRMGLIR